MSAGVASAIAVIDALDMRPSKPATGRELTKVNGPDTSAGAHVQYPFCRMPTWTAGQRTVKGKEPDVVLEIWNV